jgi:hypothetical protein
MKFGVYVVPLEDNPISYFFLFTAVISTNVTNAVSRQVDDNMW